MLHKVSMSLSLVYTNTDYCLSPFLHLGLNQKEQGECTLK
jgi:hypothetical protein